MTNLFALDWSYVLLFFLLRVAGCIFFAVVTFCLRKGLKFFITAYLSATWLDSIIYGIPIITALYGMLFLQFLPILISSPLFHSRH
jgi:hypothetical protein